MMGTTVTTNLGLIKPDIAESIKQNLPTFQGWAAQNAVNMDKIDALFRCDFNTYTLNWTATSVNPAIGTGGLLEGKYVRLHPRMVIAFFRLNVGGAGAVAGTGTYQFNLPTGVATEFQLNDLTTPMGKATFLDSSAVPSSSVFQPCWDNTAGKIFFRISNGDVWTHAVPVALGQQDRLSGYVIYPTADA